MMLRGYRKFILAMFSVLCLSVLVGLGQITEAAYSTLMLSTLGGFLAANTLSGKKTEKES